MAKRYLKTIKAVIKELKAGKEVLSGAPFGRTYKYKMIDGVICRYTGDGWVLNDCLSSSDKTYIEEPESLNLEVGRFYKTRDGRKAWIVAHQQGFHYPYNVAVVGNTGICTVLENGCFCEGRTSPDDLVAPWED